jgi:hypothetical protein
MKSSLLFLICSLCSLGLEAQSVIGAWERSHIAESGKALTSVVLFVEGYQVLVTYQTESGKFVHTNGGTWKLEGDTMTEKVEFHSDVSEYVGKESVFQVEVTDATLHIVGSDLKFKKIDDGLPGKLLGAWLMSGRIKDGEMQRRDTHVPRKTMKILTGTRFQWIAYNTETREFMGTGGGTYTTLDGKYTENIEFFSKDNTRVGKQLEFDYELTDGQWHHQGFSSQGNPLNEFWSRRD